jgi:hypothetical protein
VTRPEPSAARQASGLALFAAALLSIAAVGGGWLALGRVDPLLAVPGIGWAAILCMTVGGWRSVLRPALILALLAATLLAAVQWLAAGWLDPLPTLFAAIACFPAATLAGLAMRHAGAQSRGVRAATLLALAVGAWTWQLAAWPLVALAYRGAAPAGQGEVLVLTSLPLFAASRGSVADLLQGKTSEAPAVTELRRHVRLVPVADVDRQQLQEAGALLLAHPAALPPATLVAIDDWVQGGGRAVVLADAMLGAEPPFPLGDPRNPPVSTLLDPLLSHWGVTIAPANAAVRVVRDGRHRLILSSAGEVLVKTARCHRTAEGLVARCRLGRGEAVIVGDADLLEPALWDGSVAKGPVGWRSANIAWLASELTPPLPRQGGAFVHPVWVR